MEELTDKNPQSPSNAKREKKTLKMGGGGEELSSFMLK